MKKFINIIKTGLIQFWFMILDLLTDKAKDNGNVRKISLGRVCFLVLFFVSLLIWLSGTDIQQNMLVVLGALLTYVFGTKVTDNWGLSTKSKIAKINEPVIVDPEEAGD